MTKLERLVVYADTKEVFQVSLINDNDTVKNSFCTSYFFGSAELRKKKIIDFLTININPLEDLPIRLVNGSSFPVTPIYPILEEMGLEIRNQCFIHQKELPISSSSNGCKEIITNDSSSIDSNIVENLLRDGYAIMMDDGQIIVLGKKR